MLIFKFHMLKNCKIDDKFVTMTKYVTPKSDELLWADLIDGNKEAFKIIYNSHIQSLLKYGRHITKDESLVKDCIQDLFIDLYNSRSKLTMARNIKIYLLVSLKRKIIRSISKEEKNIHITSENIPFIYSLANDDEENEVRSNRIELLENAMVELSNRQREAIYLRYVSELSYEELSDVLQMNYQSARNLIYRSTEKLRESCRMKSILLLFSFVSIRFFKNK